MKNKKKETRGCWKKQTVKKRRKVEENKIKEKDMWDHLAKSNSEFRHIKKAKIESKKISETIIN